MDVTCSHSLISSCGQCRWRLGLQIRSGAFHFESQSKRLLSRRTGAANTQWTWGEMYYDNSLCCKQALQVEVRSCGQVYWTRLPACKGYRYCLRLTLGCKEWLSGLSLSLLQGNDLADPNHQTFYVFCDMGKLFRYCSHQPAECKCFWHCWLNVCDICWLYKLVRLYLKQVLRPKIGSWTIGIETPGSRPTLSLPSQVVTYLNVDICTVDMIYSKPNQFNVLPFYQWLQKNVPELYRNCDAVLEQLLNNLPWWQCKFWSVRSKLNPQQSPAICSWTWMGVGCWYPCFRIAWKMTEKYKLFLTFHQLQQQNYCTSYLCAKSRLSGKYIFDHPLTTFMTFHWRSMKVHVLQHGRLGRGTQDVRPPWSLDPEHEPCEQRKSREPGWRIQWHLGQRWKVRFQTQGPDNPRRHWKDQRTRHGSIMIPPLVTMWDWSANEIPLVDQIPHFQRSLQSITALGSRSDSQINSRFCDLTVSRNPTTSDHLPSSLLHTWIMTL